MDTVASTSVTSFPVKHRVFKEGKFEDKYLQMVIVSLSCLSVRPHGTTWLPLDGF
jgi:hypothetical protein